MTDRATCLSRFPDPIDQSNCAPSDHICVTSCAGNLYFNLAQAYTTSSTYDWAANNADGYVRQTNVCYLCHRFCLSCSDKYDYTCSTCASGFFKWQQYSNKCGYYCPEGDYTAGGKVGEYVHATYSWDPPSPSRDYNTYRQCKTCDAGCEYCATSSSTCYMCQDNYFLLDDYQTCQTTFNCPSCSVSDGCASRDKYCRPSNCPAYFYFPVYRTGYSNDSSGTNARYLYFTQATSMYTYNNYYDGGSDRTLNTSSWSRWGTGYVNYRYYTNYCKLCDKRCMTCYGPTNTQCTTCVNLYYKWTNADTCESYCPIGQFQQNISATYPTN